MLLNQAYMNHLALEPRFAQMAFNFGWKSHFITAKAGINLVNLRKLIHSPSQVPFGLLYPSLHSHLKPPALFTQYSSPRLQLWVPWKHSSTSNKEEYELIRWKIQKFTCKSTQMSVETLLVRYNGILGERVTERQLGMRTRVGDCIDGESKELPWLLWYKW